MLDFSDFSGDISPIEYFLEISRIPRPSGHTDKIADYLVDFASRHGLEYSRDKFNNVIIKKPATVGLESAPGVIIQGHTDIVAVKEPGLDIDMTREGVSCYRDGDFIRAHGTSLGADDGVAIAYGLALLASRDIPHPPLEVLLTSDEETSLVGATNLNASYISGRMLLNIDSDDEGIFTVGCAGGARCDIKMPLTREKYVGRAYEITLSGLLGGHSGIEIDKGRVNGIVALATLLKLIPDIRIISISGGVADNAIPPSATARFVASSIPESALSECLGFLKEIEADAKLSINSICTDALPIDRASSNRILDLIVAERCGVIKMSEDISGLVETSANIGVVSTADKEFSLTISVRSSKNGEKRRVISEICEIAEAHGAKCSSSGEYPAWEYRKNSSLRDLACQVFCECYGKDAKVITIHAGLECGIFADKIDGLDCISLGPDNFDIHTTNEHLSISSFLRVWEYLKALLSKIK